MVAKIAYQKNPDISKCLTHNDPRFITTRNDFLDICQYEKVKESATGRRKKRARPVLKVILHDGKVKPSPECMAKLLRILEEKTDMAIRLWCDDQMNRKLSDQRPAEWPVEMSLDTLMYWLLDTFGLDCLLASIAMLVKMGYIRKEGEQREIQTYYLQLEVVQQALLDVEALRAEMDAPRRAKAKRALKPVVTTPASEESAGDQGDQYDLSGDLYDNSDSLPDKSNSSVRVTEQNQAPIININNSEKTEETKPAAAAQQQQLPAPPASPARKQQENVPPETPQMIARRELLARMTPEQKEIHASWQALYKVDVLRPLGLKALALYEQALSDFVELKHTTEELRSQRNFVLETATNDFFKKHGVQLWHMTEHYNAWEMTQQSPVSPAGQQSSASKKLNGLQASIAAAKQAEAEILAQRALRTNANSK